MTWPFSPEQLSNRPGASGNAACGPHPGHTAPLDKTTEHMVREETFLPVKIVEKQGAPLHVGTGRGQQTSGCTALGTCHPPTSPSPPGGFSRPGHLCPHPSESTVCPAILTHVGLAPPPPCLPIFLGRSFFPPSWCSRSAFGHAWVSFTRALPAPACLPV